MGRRTYLTSDDEEKTPRGFSRNELEDMVHRWDFSENEWACRDLLIAAFPEAVSRWSAEELSEMDAMDLMAETDERDPKTAIQMMKLLLDTAEMHLLNPEAAYFLLGNELYDLCLSGYIAPGRWSTLRQMTAWPGSSFSALIQVLPRRTFSCPALNWGKKNCGRSCWIFWPAIPSLMTRSNWNQSRSNPGIFVGAYSLYRRAKN